MLVLSVLLINTAVVVDVFERCIWLSSSELAIHLRCEVMAVMSLAGQKAGLRWSAPACPSFRLSASQPACLPE